MKLRFGTVIVLFLAACPLMGQLQDAATADGSLLFRETVQPILQDRCLACHNQKVRSSGLSLESRPEILTGGSRGPAVVPGDSEQSRLIQALDHSSELNMPPGGKLPEAEIHALRRWVASGAPWDETGDSGKGGHWSFQAVRRPAPPRVNNPEWVRTPIDRFILRRLEEEGLEPSPPASRITLLRRLSLDLLGLPPSPAAVDRFLADTRPGAYERAVERLLASPHYGERWGRHWLDVARYADSDGFSDGPRQIWMYRDWVVRSLNRDLPFDRFTIRQLAADLVPDAPKEQIVATGFHRNTLLNQEGGIDVEQYRVERVVDRVETTGAAFLGLTVGCARCHDHKYDPVSQKEFFQLYSFFNNIEERSPELEETDRPRHWPFLEFGSDREFARRDIIRSQLALLDEELKTYERDLLARLPQWEKGLGPERLQEFPLEVRRILALPPGARNEIQLKTLHLLYKEQDLGYSTRTAGIDSLKQAEPMLPSTLVMKELPEPREAYVHLGGEFTRRGAPVQPDVPAVLPPLQARSRPDRLDLARWLVDPEHPLTARVTVNRIWQRYFGTGLVETENDFGIQGAHPSHPALLDWLASELIRQGWSLKAMHRLIVTSATYRQSSNHREDASRVDPGNRLLARQHRLRLESEVVRDVCLAASGLWNRTVGGPPVFPPQPQGSSRLGHSRRKWVASQGADRYRRGLYTHFWRSTPHPALMVFDSPNGITTCTRRSRSTSPLQALTLLNDEAFYELAQGLARRVLREGPVRDADRIDYTFRVCLSRPPSTEESTRLQRFLDHQRNDLAQRPREARSLLPLDSDDEDPQELAAWTLLSSVLLNLDEFITRE